MTSTTQINSNSTYAISSFDQIDESFLPEDQVKVPPTPRLTSVAWNQSTTEMEPLSLLESSEKATPQTQYTFQPVADIDTQETVFLLFQRVHKKEAQTANSSDDCRVEDLDLEIPDVGPQTGEDGPRIDSGSPVFFATPSPTTSSSSTVVSPDNTTKKE